MSSAFRLQGTLARTPADIGSAVPAAATIKIRHMTSRGTQHTFLRI